MKIFKIVLGAGRNSFFDIRWAMRTGMKATMQTPDLLNGMKSQGFMGGGGELGLNSNLCICLFYNAITMRTSSTHVKIYKLPKVKINHKIKQTN